MSGRICITGANGFVGRHALAAPAFRGRPIRAIVRSGQEHLLPAGVEAVTTADLFAENEHWWTDVLTDVDIVVHLAWIATPGTYLNSPLNHACLTGTLSMARGAVAAGVRRVIGIGTCFEYELSDRPLSIATPLKPMTPYAGAKAAAFLALSGYFAPHGTEFAWCRLFYLFGEGEDPRRLVPSLHSRLAAGQPVDLTQGLQVRDFLDVAIAGAMIADIAMGSMVGPVNVCSGYPITVRALAEAIADQYGRRDLLQFGARPENSFDPPYVVGVP